MALSILLSAVGVSCSAGRTPSAGLDFSAAETGRVPGTFIHVDDLDDGLIGTGTRSDPFRDLQTAIDRAPDGAKLLIAPGTYHARPQSLVEELCGNCLDHQTRVTASRGFLVSGRSLELIGSGTDSTILVTGAGYGILFVDCPGARVTGVKVTGGVRDIDGNATDAAIVVRNSRVTIDQCLLADNDDRADSVVVGIGGVFGREGAELVITNNIISNNGWDGIALYRGSTAFIADNVITGGRGAGIGITWDATAIVLRNSISEYWKGIGSFGNSRVIARNNYVHDNLGWGIIATGSSFMEAANNSVINNGNCGCALWSEDAGAVFYNNLIIKNGWRDEWVCPQVGLWVYGEPKNFFFGYNNVWGNAKGDYRDCPDMTGRNGNISAAPRFIDPGLNIPAPASPLLDAGSPEYTDPDGSRSDIGLLGGPAARNPFKQR